jgi:hypothetical protein
VLAKALPPPPPPPNRWKLADVTPAGTFHGGYGPIGEENVSLAATTQEVVQVVFVLILVD